MQVYCTSTYCYSNIIGVIFILTVESPKITQHPKDQSVASGSDIDFSIKATGDNLLFQWKKNGHDLSDNDKYHGTTTHTLMILKMEESDEANYSCFVKNDVGELLSDPALLRISKFVVATSSICIVKVYNQISQKYHFVEVYCPIIDDATSSTLYKPRNNIFIGFVDY